MLRVAATNNSRLSRPETYPRMSLCLTLSQEYETIILGQTAVHPPLTPAEICSPPYPHITPNISNHHRPAAPCPRHQSVPALDPLINDDLHWRALGQEKRGKKGGTGADVLTAHATPWCHSATQWQASGEPEDARGVEEGDLQVRGGSGAGEHMAPAGNVTLSDVSGQAKYNLVSTWKDVL